MGGGHGEVLTDPVARWIGVVYRRRGINASLLGARHSSGASFFDATKDAPLEWRAPGKSPLLRRVGAARRRRPHLGRRLRLAQQHQPARLVVEHRLGVLDDRRRMLGGNFTAPFSSMWMRSPGATSMPPTDTGTLTACTAISPWPAVTPPSRSWNLSLRIASTSRDGPFESMPTQPTAIIELTIISPARPALFMQLGRPFLLDHQDGRLLHGVERVDHVHEGEPAGIVRIGQAVDAGHGVADDRRPARDRCSGSRCRCTSSRSTDCRVRGRAGSSDRSPPRW